MLSARTSFGFASLPSLLCKLACVPEPRLRTILFIFKTRPSADALTESWNY